VERDGMEKNNEDSTHLCGRKERKTKRIQEREGERREGKRDRKRGREGERENMSVATGCRKEKHTSTNKSVQLFPWLEME
jgi:hypothetical protein